MSLLPVFEAVQDSSIGTAIRQSLVVFPVIETVHVVGLASSVGLILITDLRLIGAVLTSEQASSVMKQLRSWMLSGFAVMFASGALLFWAEAGKLYNSPAFRIKMIFLALAGLNALLFETSSRRAIQPRHMRWAGWMSLVCWAGVVVFGRWTAYGLQ